MGVEKRKEKRPGGGEPEYEEVGPQRNKVEKNDRDSVRLCELCGSVEAAVRCEKCNGQAFCFSCDDMYHRHPRRSTHSRKALHSLPKDEKTVRPPLPPKDGQNIAPPQPPPRRHKRPSFLPSNSTNKKEEQEESGKSIMGSLRRFMGTRPLPAPPDLSNGDCNINSQNLSSMSGLTRSKTAPTALSENNLCNQSLAVAIPQSIMELNRKGVPKPAASMPPTPISAHSQYPPLQPRNPLPTRDRKLSLQQFPPSFDEKRASMMEVPPMNQTWGKQPPAGGFGVSGKGRSQSISNEQWNQLIEMRSANPTTGGLGGNVSNTDLATIPPHHPGFVPTVGHGRNMGIGGRGMVTSASVCDLNTLSQQQQRSYPNMPSANSFQQLSLMNYDGGNMMWVPSCALCQPPPMYPPSMGSGGMKRTTSNISMNMSSVGSDVTGYPWANNPHVHHMPPMYPPGYYPGCHQHMMPHMAMQGSAMSIPDSTRSFSRMPPSPAPSLRSNSHRSHKSSKARSYCGGDPGGRKSRNRSRRRSDSDDSRSSSLSENEQVQIPISRPTVKSGLAWQCDHCTFINPGHALTCGMCSKTLSKIHNESHSRRGSDRRKNGSRRKTDQEENISDYDNDKRVRKRNGRESRNEHRPKGSGSLKGTAKPPRNKSRQKESLSRSPSLSGSNEDEGSKLERQLKDLRISSRSRTGDYDRLSMTSRAKESGSLKREGGSRYKNRRRFNSERSRTPARSSPSRRSGRSSINSDEGDSPLRLSPSSDNVPAEQRSSRDGTLIASESRTIKAGKFSEVKNYSKYISKEAKSSESGSGSESPEDGDDDDDGDDDNEEVPEEIEEDLEVFEKKSESPRVQEESKGEKIYAKEVRAKIGQPEEINFYEANNNFRIEIEEPPSFANTLDGIETLKTNEVADADPNSQAIEDRPSSSEVHLPDFDDIIPVLNYKPPENNYIYYEDAKEDRKEGQNEVKGNDIALEIGDSNTVNKSLNGNVLSLPVKPSFRKVEEPSYETMEEQEKETFNVTKYAAEETKKGEGDIFPKLSFAKEKLLSSNEENALQGSNSPNEERNLEEVNMSSSLESLNEILPGQRFTPLSFSSSEALFYSPPDSPELTVSEKQRRQMNQAAPHADDDLVTALETINSSERDLKSSRETIRSSVEQLPFTEEKFEDAEGSRGHSIEKSSSATLSPVTPDKVPISNLKDSIHIPLESRHLKRSISEQMLSANVQQRLEPMKKEAILNPSLKEKPKRVPSIVMTEDEDEIDEKFLTVKELIARRRQKAMKRQGLELVQLLRDAEDYGYSPEEVSVALSLSGDKGPIEWLEENWGHMVNTVKALASNYGQDKNVNDIGNITLFEAKRALRAHKGNIWAAVTECVEERRKNFSEIYSKGNFPRADIIKALEAHNGDYEEASVELNKTGQLSSSFFKKIWAPAEEAMHSVSTLFRRESMSKVMISAEVPPSAEDDQIPLRKPNDTISPTTNENDYANVEMESKKEDENVGGIYANVVTPLLRKIEETLQKANAKVPALSEDLKRKIVKAIIEGDPEAPNPTFNFDSDDESTIEELLAVAENPSFYEYFTAVDLEDDYEDESAEDEEEVDDEEESANESSFNETQDNLTDQEDEQLLGIEVTSEFEYKDDFKSSENDTKLLATQKEVIQGTDNDDVGVLPLHPSQYETKPSKLRNVPVENKSVVEVKGPSVSNKFNASTIEDPELNFPKASSSAPFTATKDDTFKLSTNKEIILNTNKDKIKKQPNANIATEAEKKKNVIKPTKKQSQKMKVEEVRKPVAEPEEELELRSEEKSELPEEEESDDIEFITKEERAESDDTESFTKEEGVESGEQGSMSVTTGRLSLSVRQTGDKKANIDVKSQTIQTDIVSLPHQAEETASSKAIKSIGTKSDASLNMAETPPLENYPQSESENEQEDINIRQSPVEMLDPDEAAKVRAHGGPVTVQKATQIVGKAIAKAMARESTVRRDSYSSEESSQNEIPTPPPSTPDPEETPEKFESTETTDSENELQRSLDTIPEEEEASERTASGRVITRSAKTDSGYQKASKAISIPPAVASFSGPIFIPPSVPSASSAAGGPSGASTHSYYNVPKDIPSGVVSEVKNNQTLIKKPVNTDYESLSQEKNDLKPASSKAAVTTTSSLSGPLTTEETKKQSADDSNVKLTPTPKNKSSIIVKNNSNLKLVSKISIPSKFNQTAAKELPSDSSVPLQNKPRKEASPQEVKATTQSTLTTLEVQEKPPTGHTSPEVKLNKAGKKIRSVKSEDKSSDSSQSTIESSSVVRKSPIASPSKRLQQTKRRSTIDSSGESEDEEELAAAAHRINLINEQKRSPQSLLLKVEEGRKRFQTGNNDYEDANTLKRKESPINLDAADLDSTDVLLQDLPEPPAVVIHPQTDEEDEGEEEEEKSVTITDFEKDHEYEQLRFDRTVRRLLAEGQATSYEKAELAARLLTFSFDETDSIQAAEGCSSLYSALQFLQQDCELCASKFPMGRMVSMLHCVHRCCYDCANNYFSFQIKTKNIRELRCPFCNEPDLEKNEDTGAEYLNNMDILLKNILDEETHELFQRKLRDWTLMKDPNFKWCNKCSSGFIANPRARKLICPDCKDVTCANCRKPWELQHEGITCEDFNKWKEENDPEHQAEGVDKHLAECGITCPNCKFTYALAKGGCMHFTCTECKYEFCSGCNKPFKQGAKCTVGPYCERLGLHAHHPRNCLFYLRDKDPGQLQQLLKEHNIYFNVDSPKEGTSGNGRVVCSVQEQKETVEGLKDEVCGRAALEGNAGLCRQHYVEYLGELVHYQRIDPIQFSDEEDLRYILRRDNIQVPRRIQGELDFVFRQRLRKLIKEQLPLC